LFWIHGGGFTAGSASQDLYDGGPLATRGDVVVVTINYRLGVLGLMSHPSLRDPETGAMGNWALLDQIAALRWVRDNIAAFGGDPQRITIFGESAGGASVGMLCISPLAQGLFQRAIAQSGSPLPIPLEQSVEGGEQVYTKLGLASGDAEKLRRATVEQILEAQPAWALTTSRGRTAPRPALDSVVLPDWPDQAVDRGRLDGVELIVGTTRDEFRLLAMQDPKRGTLDRDGLLRRVSHELGDDVRAREVVETYSDARGGRGEATEPWDLWCAIQTDRLIRAPSFDLLERHCARGGRGRAYVVTWESPAALLGACHAIELPFCFGTLNTAPGMHAFAGKGPDADQLQQRMTAAWAELGRSGEPAGWPEYAPGKETVAVFGADPAESLAHRPEELAAWH
jgi:para-nitrobenzyl esterase